MSSSTLAAAQAQSSATVTADAARRGIPAGQRLLGLRCRECGQQYAIEPIHVCDFCFGPLEVQYDYEHLARTVTRESIERGPLNIWRYHDLLPVEELADTGWRVGYTPLQPAPNLGRALGLQDLWIKNDSVNPTFSFKDRVVAVASAKAREFGFDTFACASTGNLASAVAAAGIRVGLKTFVFLPWDTEQTKILNALVYGATLVAVKGTYDDVNRLCSEIADQRNWAFCNINVRPYYSEGSKTLAFETAEQLGWEAPDHVVVPVASGSLLTKIAKGFDELQKIGLIPTKHVTISGAQALGCNPVAEAFGQGWDAVKPVQRPDTVAKSLAIGNPADGYYVLKIVRERGGAVRDATNEEIAEGMLLLASTEGVFAETAGGVTVAVLKKLIKEGVVKPDQRVVAYITGNGLKTIEAVQPALTPPPQVEPSLAAFEAFLQQHESLENGGHQGS
ncbi:MAG TPA: threonine synthase [Chloroflexota bacterium]|nr:threonine synthase [Chloroflexota bacterium]